MTLAELLAKLNREIRTGRLDPDEAVRVRNTSVSEGAMEAGSDGYLDLDEVLVVDGAAMLLIEAV